MSGLAPQFQAAILGLVQGVCEFLPISSSAHLVILPKMMGWPYLGKSFDVALHFGTLSVLVIHFREELSQLGRAAQRYIFHAGKVDDPSVRLLRLLVLASVPAAVAGFLLDDLVEPYCQGLFPVGMFSVLWGVMMGYSEARARIGDASAPASCCGARRLSSLGRKQAFLIGCAQATALLPGTSRTGATLTAGLLSGLSRPEAARFSLLLSIPVVAGAAVFRGWDQLSQPSADWTVVLIGVLTSALAGRFCLKRFLAYLETGSLLPFVAYRVVFGSLVLAWWFLS
jgi:undecaprenyl-diphosphatase